MRDPFVIGISPLETPDPSIVAALSRCGAVGVLDLGRDRAIADRAIAETARRVRRFAVRIHDGVVPELPAAVDLVIADAGSTITPGRRLWVQVTSEDEARAAIAAGADGLVIKGGESGGRVGEETAFVLAQRLARLGLPFWVQGGIGLHTAAACAAIGASGVVLDSQLALFDECSLSKEQKDLIRALDGSETVVEDDRRFLSKPNAPRLPLGQDAAFARPLHARFGTISRLVRGLTTAADGHLRQARALAPIAPGAPLAAAHGLRYPIAQGPMTRVSDRAGFALAVAEAGALPFLALSLMRGAEARTLLEDTRRQLGDRPWGVGVLGFVPPELREEQLALLAEIRPPVVLIAGGRPAQAAPLEALGITTYLHVPSPGLLDLFLKDGARRFVLEGRECGGHVGPRSSFTLWEGAITRLLEEPDLSGVSVLFAGGVHDARSAAMVAAAAAPLAARGAKLGVLVGTAYLFTEEAVASGAIQPGFQTAAMACERTVLVDTAPGHSTRCVASPFVDAFRAERARLEAAGADPRAMWEALEQLNLGRLRIAAKGLRRDGDALVSVGDEDQRREGMFMIGQVAALRRGLTTCAALHADIGDAPAILETAHVPAADAKPCDVAIVGMASIFPGAPDLASYWGNIVAGKNAVTEVPRDRWNPDVYFDPKGAGEKTPSKWGGFLPDIAFDPTEYGIPPRSLAAIEPVQLLALEVARRALDDAGYGDRPFDRERCSVVFGAEAGTELSGGYGFRAQHPQLLGPLPEALDGVLPRLTEDSFPGVLTNVIAGRVANRLDLGGMNYTVDAACASSLAAVDAAVKELAAGSSDMVLCGGADLHNGIHDYLMFASVHALSPTGQCRPFDAAADGIALGEGVAAVVLKRLADAERDGDRIYAVIRGIGASSDGRHLGLTAPRKEGQVRALERAYAQAGISPADVQLVEAHGTGTVVGDRTELGTLAELWGAAGALPGKTTLGSVKSQIGHTKCAAGMAGLIKAALAIHTGVLPPTRNLGRPNPAYDARTSPFAFRDVAQPWAVPVGQRRAGVSAFGFGGTNFHIVLDGIEEAAAGAHEWPAELFLVHGQDHARLLALAEKPYRLRDLARSAAAGSGALTHAFVATSLEDLAEKLRQNVGAVRPIAGSVAVLFSGQGSQRPGMLRELFVSFPSLSDLLERGARFTGRMFPPAALTPDERQAQQAAITDTRVAQPALGIADLAVWRLLDEAGVRPAMLGGHSYGELVALTVAGVLPEEQLVALSEARAEAILAAAAGAPGTMAAVPASAQDTERLVTGTGVVCANRNAPDQTVIAGSDAAVEAAIEKLAAAGIRAKKLPVACAFHSPVVAGGAARFAERLAEVPFGAPRATVFANATAAPYPADGPAARALLAEQIASPVRFAEQIEAMYAAGARIFVEAGPGNVLADLVRRNLGDRPHLAVACDTRDNSLVTLLAALAQLAAAGVAIDPAPLFVGRDAKRYSLAEPPPVGPSPNAWIVNGHTARPLVGEPPDFAMKIVRQPLAIAPAASPSSARERTVLEYLKGMREMVEGQRQVMLRYLGSAALPEPIEVVAVTPQLAAAVEPVPVVVSADPLTVLVGIVSERTGYPPEMLDPDLDLEADLGIDSIKRIEILGTLAERLGMRADAGGKRSELVEELATVKTLRGIAAWLARKNGPAAVEAPPSQLGRYVLAAEPAPATPGALSVFEKRFALTRDGAGIAEALAALLEARGARVRLLDGAEPLGEVDGLIHLASFVAEPDVDPRKTLFARAKEAIAGGVTWLVAASRDGGAFGRPSLDRRPHGGIAGLMKSVAKEAPSVKVRAVDLDPAESPDVLAAILFAELIADDPHVEVGYIDGQRQVLRLLASSPTPQGRELLLGPDSVVLITGGARGITARVAIALAEAHRCHLEIVGRTPLPATEDAELAACADAPAIRRLLLTRLDPPTPAAVEAETQRVLAARATRETLTALDKAGAPWRYHAVDVRDAAAFGAVIDDVYARHGRIDGVIHGAGVIEDKLLSAKTADSFDRVFDTKVAGAWTLVDKLRPGVHFVCFFSSISGAFGNRGQVDYAAANDALDKLAHYLSRCMLGRIVSINWGPWGGAGMITPELEREYGRRGIGLIAPDEGVARLLDELRHGQDTQVVYLHGKPEDFGAS